MATSGIVPPFDVAEDRHPGLGLRCEAAAGQQLAFQCGEEALAHGVVVGVTDGSHGWAHAGFPAAPNASDVYWADSNDRRKHDLCWPIGRHRRPTPRCLTVTLDEFISIAGYHRKHVIWRRCFRRCWWPTWTSIAPCSVSSRTSRRCAPVPQAASWTRPARDALPEAGRLRGMVRLVSPRNAIWILNPGRRHPSHGDIPTRSVPDVA